MVLGMKLVHSDVQAGPHFRITAPVRSAHVSNAMRFEAQCKNHANFRPSNENNDLALSAHDPLTKIVKYSDS